MKTVDHIAVLVENLEISQEWYEKTWVDIEKIDPSLARSFCALTKARPNLTLLGSLSLKVLILLKYAPCCCAYAKLLTLNLPFSKSLLP